MTLTKLSKTPIYGFDWSLNFQKILSPRKSKKSKGKVLKSPVIGRGIFAILSLGLNFYDNRIFAEADNDSFWTLIIRRRYFDVGGLDQDLEENQAFLEFSLRNWLCGGRIAICPCSHVGLITINPTFFSRKVLEFNWKFWIKNQFK